MAFDFKKEYSEFYMPKNKPQIVTVPPANYIAVRGMGDPNEEGGAYKAAIGVLYAVAYTIKMSKMGDHRMAGYFDFVVPPLEGFWWQEGVEGVDYSDKSAFHWISVIRLPEFVTKTEFDWAVAEAARKKKLDCSAAEFLTIDEGQCVQIMHVGPFDDEQVLKSVLSRVKENYDYILIDCMPSLGLMSVNALVAADSVIIPSAPDFLSTKGLNLLIRTISRVRRQINPKLKIDGILMTMVDGRTNNAKSCYDGVELYRRADFQYADPRGVREDGRPGRAGDDGAVTKNRSISLDNFVRFVYNGNTPKGGLTYVHYRNRTKTEPREISSAGSHPGHLYHPQRENHCQAGISLPGPRGHR